MSGKNRYHYQDRRRSLNPYSIGRYSMSLCLDQLIQGTWGLNPYSIGRYSMSQNRHAHSKQVRFVLILILLEDTL